MAALRAGMLCSTAAISRPQPAFAARPAQAAPARAMTVVAMAKPSKAADFRGLSTEDIEAKVYELKKELFFLRVKKAKREEFKPSEFKRLRLSVAQLLTIKREREIEQGVSKRDSRAAAKRRMVEAGLGKFR